ncbi:RNA polymerase factor sigma-54 [Acidobacteria bacterium AH-259-D05]|nr:RNA polymerase factor sigma-54 [Acidobacteria bacterium AH-259-D05]
MVRRHQLRHTLGLHLSQRLAMTPSLLQKIELLTLNRLELSDLLNQELAENPVLEEVAQQPEVEGAESFESEKEQEKDEESYDDFDYEYFFGEYLSPSSPPSREWGGRDEQPSFELFLATPPTLSDHLNWQLNLTEVPSEIREIAYFIIGNIDEDGYLIVTVEEIVESFQVSTDQVEEALRLVQSLDPIGVGSRNLQECLLLQIEAVGHKGTLAEKLVREYLPLVQAKKFNQLAKELNCDLEEVALAMETLRNLSPKPGQKYSAQRPTYIQPDVHIYKVDDEYEIALNDDGLPKLRLSRAYRELLKKKSVSKETKRFVRERFRSAIELLKSVDQRQQTIYRACVEIVKRQRAFLDRGIIHLKPMLIKDVAEELGVHSSTISRVVANKHAHTPQGVMELRKFFTSGIESADGESLSVVQVKEHIKGIIANENAQKPLSDQKIAALLNQSGVHITRRTVAKYRDQMNVPGSRERKMAVLF